METLSPATAPESLLTFAKAREHRKRTVVNVAFTREYSMVSYPQGTQGVPQELLVQGQQGSVWVERIARITKAKKR